MRKNAWRQTPEYAAMMAERKAEYTRTRTAKRQAEREALVELAKTDEEAAKKLAEMRKYQSQATVRSYQKMKPMQKPETPMQSNAMKLPLPNAGKNITERTGTEADVSAPSITSMIQKMEKSGYIVRNVDEKIRE